MLPASEGRIDKPTGHIFRILSSFFFHHHHQPIIIILLAFVIIFVIVIIIIIINIMFCYCWYYYYHHQYNVLLLLVLLLLSSSSSSSFYHHHQYYFCYYHHHHKPYTDFKYLIGQYIFSTWQDDWNGAVMNKLHYVKPVLGDWQSSYRRCSGAGRMTLSCVVPASVIHI